MPHRPHAGRSRARVIAFCIAIGVGAPAFAGAQNVFATIAGQAADETGAVLPGVSIVIRDAKAGRDRVVMTDGVGRFTAGELAPGSFTITASLAGFEELVRSAVNVPPPVEPADCEASLRFR